MQWTLKNEQWTILVLLGAWKICSLYKSFFGNKSTQGYDILIKNLIGNDFKRTRFVKSNLKLYLNFYFLFLIYIKKRKNFKRTILAFVKSS